MTNSEQHERCASLDVPCVEVIARLDAADRAEHEWGASTKTTALRMHALTIQHHHLDSLDEPESGG